MIENGGPGVILVSLFVLFDAFGLRHAKPVHAQGALKVYVQLAKDKQWTNIEGTEIIGFSCINQVASNDKCFVASR